MKKIYIGWFLIFAFLLMITQKIIGIDLNAQIVPIRIIGIFVIIGIFGLWIWMLTDFIKRAELKQLRYRFLWGCMLILANLVAGIIYFIFIYSPRERNIYLAVENYQSALKTDSLLVYAGFWERFFAFFIDIVIVVIFLEITMRIVFGSSQGAEEKVVFRNNGLLHFAVLTLYFAVMEISKWQGTVGKILLNVKVTDENGNKVTFIKSLIRNVSKLLSAAALNMGFFMIAFTSRRQGLHDMIAHCLVVRCPVRPSAIRKINVEHKSK